MEKQPIRSYSDLEVWRRGMDLAEQVYALTRTFPVIERFGLSAQLRRAVVSVPSNIAEGWGRNSRAEYVHFLRIARGSLTEVEAQVILAFRLGYLGDQEQANLLQQTNLESRMLLNLMRALTRR